jgi:hypothetical protein
VRVDWDLLADHLGGALEGTPEGAEVARLVGTDPSWARAAVELSAAFESVTADLRALRSPSLPDDVALRLESALVGVAAAPDVATRSGPTTLAPAGRAGTEPRRPPARPGAGPRRRRRRMVGWGAGFTVAAGLAVFAALGLAALDLDQPLSDIVAGGADDADSGDGAAAPVPNDSPGALDAEPEERAGEGVAGPVVIATGTEYEAPMLVTDEPEPPASGRPGLGGAEEPAPAPAAPEFGTDSRDDVPEQVPPELLELWIDPEARADCLAMVRDSVKPAPVRIDTVDFARYEGEDALVIWLTTSDGLRRALVSGPECGTVTAGPDLKFQTQVS